jgi:bacterioferritin-associated ferredoxin
MVLEALDTLPISSIKDLKQHTGAGDGCTACHKQLKQFLERYASASPICSVK